jgi:hypothetical protein
MDALIKSEIDKYEALLPMNTSVSFTEAEKRAASFLLIAAHITNWRYELSQHKIKLLSVQTAVYAEQLFKGTSKTMTENKVSAEASLDYMKAREDLEMIENDLAYLKAYYEVFNNAHIFYRGMARGNSV